MACAGVLSDKIRPANPSAMHDSRSDPNFLTLPGPYFTDPILLTLTLPCILHHIRPNLVDHENRLETIRLVLMFENNGSFSSKPYFPSTIPIMRIIISVFVDSPIHQLESLILPLI